MLLTLLCAALLAVPGAAYAQSAGDDQYADPFGPVEDPQNGPSDSEQPPPVQGQTEEVAPGEPHAGAV